MLHAEVRAHALRSMSRAEILAARRNFGTSPQGWPMVATSTLRNADDQSVVGLAAVHGTLRQMVPAEPHCWDQWGVLFASRFLGRSNLVVALNRFQSDGVWGVSPHLIPHYALHSPSGTLSLALGVHGPNLGIGGGPGSEFEGILTALTWLQAGITPGLWLILSGWTPEFLPDLKGEPTAHCVCQALALVLAPATGSASEYPRLRVVTSEAASDPRPIDLVQLAHRLDQDRRDNSRRTWLDRHHGVDAGHHRGGVPRPHFASETRAHRPVPAVVTDCSGRFQVELLTSHSQIQEAY